MNRKSDMMLEVAGGIEMAVISAVEHWRDLPEQTLKFRPSTDAWSIKEIIGHLIDSAANNHQRFLRLQLTEHLTFPDCGQDNIHRVRIQQYQEQTWAQLLDLWRHYNAQLAQIIRSIDPACLAHVWEVDAQTRVTLFELMTDYMRHLKDHPDQINANLAAFKLRYTEPCIGFAE